MTKEEFNKMKQELEAEYLATFKKTVAMHETVLTRLATHPVFRSGFDKAKSDSFLLRYSAQIIVTKARESQCLTKYLD